MTLANDTKTLLAQITAKDTKLGDLRTLAKSIKKNHPLAMALWASGHYMARQLPPKIHRHAGGEIGNLKMD